MFTKNILFMYSKNILIVDDMLLFLKTAEDDFRREQVNIIKAKCGPEAVGLIKKEKPDLVFMALDMEGGNGDDACKEIKNDYSLKSTPIILLTKGNNPEDIERCLKAGCDDFIHKPITREVLLNTSRKFVKFPSWSGKRAKIDAHVTCCTKSEEPIKGALSDISVGGVFLKTEEERPIGSELHLVFKLKHDLRPIICKGRVAWANIKTNLKKNYALPGMGIEFTDIKKLEILSVQSFVSKSL
jgi:two-component system cell cycle response regulator